MNEIELYNRELAESNCLEVDEGPMSPPRFDDLPLKLELRGTTERTWTPDRQSQRDKHQLLLWAKATVHKNTTAAKLRSIGWSEEAAKLEKCHTVYTVAVCNGCKAVKKYPNRCDLFYCAECQPRRANDRRKAVEWWCHQIDQPKHVVLTVKNLPDINTFHVLEFKKWWKNLRKRKFARNWVGGFYSIEVTNEGRGWHLHLHALINARWIDQLQLSAEWESVTNGMGRIVKVKRVAHGTYLREVLKYSVKGNMLAAWAPAEIATFIKAFNGLKTFGVFGSLYGMRTEFAEWFKAVRDSKPKCECGCNDVDYFSETAWIEMDLRPDPQVASLPPPQAPHPELFAPAQPQFPRD